MKNLKKILSITFFSLLLFTFFLMLIGDIASIGDVIDAFSQFDYTWSSIFSWFIELGVSIYIFVMSLLTLINILTNKENDQKVLIKKNCLYLAIYLATCVVSGILVLIHASGFGVPTNLALPIVLIVFEAISCITLFISTSKFENSLINKILNGIGYGTLFIVLILSASSGSPRGIGVAVIVFLFFVNIVGVAHIVIGSIDFEAKVQEEKTTTENNNSEGIKEKAESNLEERLAKLQSLHEQGLISDDEYNEKRKQIIDSL